MILQTVDTILFSRYDVCSSARHDAIYFIPSDNNMEKLGKALEKWVEDQA
jgi:hypothetical protein